MAGVTAGMDDPADAPWRMEVRFASELVKRMLVFVCPKLLILLSYDMTSSNQVVRGLGWSTSESITQTKIWCGNNPTKDQVFSVTMFFYVEVVFEKHSLCEAESGIS